MLNEFKKKRQTYLIGKTVFETHVDCFFHMGYFELFDVVLSPQKSETGKGVHVICKFSK